MNKVPLNVLHVALKIEVGVIKLFVKVTTYVPKAATLSVDVVIVPFKLFIVTALELSFAAPDTADAAVNPA